MLRESESLRGRGRILQSWSLWTGRQKFMQQVLLEAQEAAEQCVIIVLDELSCCWPVSRVQTSPDSTTNDSFDAMSIIRRHETPPRTGRVEQFGKDDWSVDSLQRLVVHAVATQHSDDVQWLRTLVDDVCNMDADGQLVCDTDAE